MGSALRILIKNRKALIESLKLPQNFEAMGYALFWHEGWLYKNYQPYKAVDFDALGNSMEVDDNIGMDSLTAKTNYKEAMRKTLIPDFVSCRIWVLENIYKEDMKNMKKAYEHDLWKL